MGLRRRTEREPPAPRGRATLPSICSISLRVHAHRSSIVCPLQPIHQMPAEARGAQSLLLRPNCTANGSMPSLPKKRRKRLVDCGSPATACQRRQSCRDVIPKGHADSTRLSIPPPPPSCRLALPRPHTHINKPSARSAARRPSPTPSEHSACPSTYLGKNEPRIKEGSLAGRHAATYRITDVDESTSRSM